MTVCVIIGVVALIFVILGYRYDSQNGKVEQGGFLQYDSVPNGATVSVDGGVLSGKTPTKNSVLTGTHTFSISKSGYETWNKTMDIKAGTLTWLDYARLVPKNRPQVPVETYTNLSSSLATLNGKRIIVEQDASQPVFNLVDVSSDTPSQSILTLPTASYTDAGVTGVTHSFRIDQWDSGGRYVLIQHTYGNKNEWLVLDTDDVTATKNVTALLDVSFTSARFSGTNGTTLFVLDGSDIRKLDLSAATISRALVSNVTSFGIYDNTIITYVGTDGTDTAKRVVGLYRDGDNAPHVLRTTTSSPDLPLNIATSRYFNNDYVAISEGSKVDVLYGNYPTSSADDGKSLTEYGSFDLAANVTNLGFSPKGYYVLAQNGANFAGYDIEHKTTGVSSVAATSSTVRPLHWLDQANLWSDADGTLTMREFDGANSLTLGSVVYGQDVLLPKDGHYLYSFGRTATGYQLQRIKMIL